MEQVKVLLVYSKRPACHGDFDLLPGSARDKGVDLTC